MCPVLAGRMRNIIAGHLVGLLMVIADFIAAAHIAYFLFVVVGCVAIVV
jgi:hypothetical protein